MAAPDLDIALQVEHHGRLVLVQGSGELVEIRSAHLITLLRFLLVLWPRRRLLPTGYRVVAAWRRFRLPVKL